MKFPAAKHGIESDFSKVYLKNAKQAQGLQSKQNIHIQRQSRYEYQAWGRVLAFQC